jgi:hypothetical protein
MQPSRPREYRRTPPSLDDILQPNYGLGKKEKAGRMASVGDDPQDSAADADLPKKDETSGEEVQPNPAQRHYLMRGLSQPGGKLPLFDADGQHIHPALVKACIAHGWAEPWFGNPLKPDWLICKLSDKGRRVLSQS